MRRIYNWLVAPTEISLPNGFLLLATIWAVTGIIGYIIDWFT